MMNWTEVLAITVAALLSSNGLLLDHLGAGTAVRQLRGVRSALTIGGAATLVMFLSTPLTWMVYILLLRTYGLEYLRLLVFLLLIILVEELLRAVFGLNVKWKPLTDELFPMAAVNSVVLGSTLLWAENNPTILEAMLAALLEGAGFTLTAVLLASIQGRLTFSSCPRAFRGIPIALVTVGLLAMAFMGFVGVRL